MNPRLSLLIFLLCFCGCANAPRPVAAELSLPASASDGILDANAVTSPPKALSTVRAAIPPELRIPGTSAKTLLRCIVLKDGRVAAVEIVSATNTNFGSASAAAVQQWTFSPAVLNGERVNCVITLPLEVSAHEGSPMHSNYH